MVYLMVLNQITSFHHVKIITVLCLCVDCFTFILNFFQLHWQKYQNAKDFEEFGSREPRRYLDMPLFFSNPHLLAVQASLHIHIPTNCSFSNPFSGILSAATSVVQKFQQFSLFRHGFVHYSFSLPLLQFIKTSFDQF